MLFPWKDLYCTEWTTMKDDFSTKDGFTYALVALDTWDGFSAQDMCNTVDYVEHSRTWNLIVCGCN